MKIASIHPRATDEEVAAIGVALAIVDEELRRASAAAQRAQGEHLSAWVDASRRAAQRSGLQRGPWRLSGRIARRSRV